jgi:hypothetical protein
MTVGVSPEPGGRAFPGQAEANEEADLSFQVAGSLIEVSGNVSDVFWVSMSVVSDCYKSVQQSVDGLRQISSLAKRIAHNALSLETNEPFDKNVGNNPNRLMQPNEMVK